MPIVNVPDVGPVQFPDTMSQAQILFAIENDILRRPQATPEFAPIPDDPGFFNALKTGVTSTAKSLPPMAQLMVNPEDKEAAANMQRVQDEAQNAFRRTEFSEIGEKAKAGDVGGALGATWSKFKELAGESIGFQAPAAGVGLAARIGVGAAATAFGVAAAPAAAIGVGAYGLTLLGQYIASNLGRQIEENKGKPVERMDATVAGAGQSALDLLGGKFLGLGKILGLEGKKASEMALKELTDAATNPVKYKRAIATGAATGIALEVPQEITQSVLERWQAGLEIDPFKDPGAAKEYAEAAAGALMLGGPLGAVGRVGAERMDKARAEEEFALREAKRLDVERLDTERQDAVLRAQEIPAPLEAKDQMALFTAPKPKTPGDLTGMAPSGETYTQPRGILGAEYTTDLEAAPLEIERQELERVRGILTRELQRATTAEQQVTQQQRLAQVNAELEGVNKQLADLGEKGPTKREAAKFKQSELGSSTYFRDYPNVPEEPVPAAVEMENLRLTKDNLLGLFKQKSRGVAKSTKLYKQLLGVDLTTTEGRSEFNRLMADADKRKVSSLDYGAVEQLMTEAARYRDATTVVPPKSRITEPTVIGEQPQPPSDRTPEQQAAFATPETPGLEVQRARDRLQQQGPSPIIAPEERQTQVGGLPLLAPELPKKRGAEAAAPTVAELEALQSSLTREREVADRELQRAKTKTQTTALQKRVTQLDTQLQEVGQQLGVQPWTPELVTEQKLDAMGIPKVNNTAAQAVRAAVEGKDTGVESDAQQVWEALSTFRDRATTTKNQREGINRFLRGAGLMDQLGLDFTTPQETPRDTKSETTRRSVGVPVLGSDAGGPGVAADGTPAVARGKRPAGVPVSRAKQTPVALNNYVYKSPDNSIEKDNPRGYKIDKIDPSDSWTGKAVYNVVDSTGEAFETFDNRADAIDYINRSRAAAGAQPGALTTETITPAAPTPGALKPKKTKVLTVEREARTYLEGMYDAKTAQTTIDSFKTGDVLDENALMSYLEKELGLKLEAPPVGAKLGDKASAAVQAGDLRGALRAIAESGSTPLMREVAKKLLSKVGNTRITLGITAGAGQYNPITDTITMSPDGMHEHTLLHEMVHAAISHVLRNRFHPLTQQLAKLYQQLAPRLRGQYGAQDVQEFAAEAQTNSDFRTSLQSIQMPQGALKTAWDHFVNAVRKFLGLPPRQSQTTLDKIDKLLNDLLESAGVEPRTPGDILFLNANVSGSPKAYAQFLNGMGQQTRDLPEMSQGWRDTVSTLGRGMSAALTKTMDLNQLSEIYADRVPALRDMLDSIGRRRGFENIQRVTLGNNLRALQKLRNKTKPGDWQVLESVVTDSTIAMYDPSSRNKSGKPDAPEGPAIQRAYNGMSSELKQVYSTVKDHYLELFKNYRAALEKDLAVLPAEERQQILDAIDSRIKPYFPLMRFGDYFLRFERNGETVTMAFESPEVRNGFIAAENVDRNAPGFRSFQSLAEALSRPPSDPMIQRTIKALRNRDVDQSVIDSVHRTLLQMYPQQSAVLNMIKRKNAPGFEQDVLRGYETLAPKLISQTASRMYNHVIEAAAANARIELESLSAKAGDYFVTYPKEGRQVSQKFLTPEQRAQFMQSNGLVNKVNGVAVRDAVTGFDPMADELARELSGEKNSRLNVALNPSMGSIAQGLNWLSYGFHMGANVSSAIVELTSIPMLAYPVLGGRYGFGKAYSALMDASKEYGKLIFKDAGKNFAAHHYLSTTHTVPKGHKYYDLIQELQARGVTNVSVAQEILDTRASRGDSMSKLRRNLGTALGIMHHHAGMANREITAMAAYELAKKAGKSEAQAVDYAISTTNQVNSSGAIETAGTVFQHPIGRVILMFKRFAHNLVFLMARTAYVAIKGDKNLTPEEQVMAKSIARKQLAGLFIMSYAFAGAQGMPFYGLLELIHDALDAAFGDDEDPQDFNLMVRNALGEMNFKGPFGALTGVDIAQRTGFGDLILRDDSRTKAELGPVRYYVEQLLGAPMGVASNTDRGFRMINEGYWERGLEAMAPSAIRNAFKANRYAIEGATTLKGDPILDDISMTESLFQLAGFSPTRLAEVFARRGAAKEVEQAIQNRKRRLLDQYEMANNSGDYDALDSVRDKITRFNELVPEYPITAKTIKDSIEGRRKREAQAMYGVQINPKLKEKIRRAIEGED